MVGIILFCSFLHKVTDCLVKGRNCFRLFLTDDILSLGANELRDLTSSSLQTAYSKSIIKVTIKIK